DAQAPQVHAEPQEAGHPGHRGVRLADADDGRVRPPHAALPLVAISTLASRHVSAHLGGARRSLSSFHRKNADRQRRASFSSLFATRDAVVTMSGSNSGPNSTLKR